MEKFNFLTKKKISPLPKNSGVYAFKKGGKILYIGKAANIKERVRQHKDLLGLAKEIGYIKTDSEIEALILEANLIKKYQPKYNITWKDDKNYFYVGITKEEFPRIFISHQPQKEYGKNSTFNIQHSKFQFVGPFVDGTALKQTLKVLRKVFPYRSCNKIPRHSCLWYHLNRCPAPCSLKISTDGYSIPIRLNKKMKNKCKKNTKNIVKIFQGKKVKILKDLKKEMKEASVVQDFEKAAKIKDQIEVLEKVLTHAKILAFEKTFVELKPWQNYYGSWRKTKQELQKVLKTKKIVSRIEAYDVSNIQGQQATGSMVTFIDGVPDKNFYRKFKIAFVKKPNDVAMIKEILSRRFNHPEWPYPDLILIDGGKSQFNAALQAINLAKPSYPQLGLAKFGNIRVAAIAKKKNELFIEGQKKPILLKTLPREIFNLILQLRDEAHRFARKYHHKLREIDLLPKY